MLTIHQFYLRLNQYSYLLFYSKIIEIFILLISFPFKINCYQCSTFTLLSQLLN